MGCVNARQGSGIPGRSLHPPMVVMDPWFLNGIGEGSNSIRGGDVAGPPTTIRSCRDGWLAAPLLAAGVLTSDRLAEADAASVEEIWPWVVARGWATSERIVEVLAERFALEVADLRLASPVLAALLPESVARRGGVVLVGATDTRSIVAASDPRDLALERDLTFLLGRTVEFRLAPPEAIRQRLDLVYPPAQAPRPGSDVPRPEGPVAQLVDAVVAEGVGAGASDIHLEPDDRAMVVRYRVDGLLREVMRLPAGAGPSLIRRVKILATLDVANPLIPADGRASARIGERVIDLRIATAPVARRGEKAVIRILDPGHLKGSLGDLGLSPAEEAALARLLGVGEGMVLVTGPTGSGKTTTLYAALNQLKTGTVNIVTVEDPVEYELPGVSQIQVREQQGLSFGGVLRSVLRQDPDIVLVGEIRDLETATVAAQAGLTGHLVLSTLHTNDAPSAILRLRDIGLDAFKIAAVLKGIVAQRLVRRLCLRCQGGPTAATCEPCHGTGFRGRVPVVEILPVSAELASLIAAGEPPAALAAAARRGGMRTLWEAGMDRVRDGETTQAELRRVLGERRLNGPR